MIKKQTLFSAMLLSASLFASTLSHTPTNNSLVIYNSNMALVHEQRTLTIDKRDTTINYNDITSNIILDSLHVELDPSIELLSQNYQDNKFSIEKLLDLNIGKTIKVRIKDSSEYINTVLISHHGSQSIVKQDEKLFIVNNADIIFNALIHELKTKPSLTFNVHVNKSTNAPMKLEYLIHNINFKSNYILSIDNDRANLDGWININNYSGKSFIDTKISLLAGDVNSVQERPVMYKQTRAMRSMAAMSNVSHVSYEGYHFYTIPFKVTLADNEKTQIKYLTKNKLHVQREYTAHMANPLYLRGASNAKVTQSLLLKGLKEPLIGGTVRTYSKLHGQTIFLGQNRIENTPKNTPLKIDIGQNFDTKVKQSVLKRDDSKSWFDVDVQYTLKNSSDKEKRIKLLIPFNTNEHSKITTSQKYKMSQGNLVTFNLIVQANASKSFSVNFQSKR